MCQGTILGANCNDQPGHGALLRPLLRLRGLAGGQPAAGEGGEDKAEEIAGVVGAGHRQEGLEVWPSPPWLVRVKAVKKAVEAQKRPKAKVDLTRQEPTGPGGLTPKPEIPK